MHLTVDHENHTYGQYRFKVDPLHGDDGKLDRENVTFGNILDNERDKLLSLIRSYKDVFAKDTKKQKPVSHTTHMIATTKDQPYRIMYAYTDAVDTQVGELALERTHYTREKEG